MSADLQDAARATPSLEGGLGFYFNGDDAIRLSGWNGLVNVVVVLSGRFLYPDGRIEPFFETHAPASNRTVTTQTYARGCGWLTDLSAIVVGAAPQRGQTYVRVDVVRGLGTSQLVLGTLLQGYVTATKRIAYPGSRLEDSLEGQGAIRSITGTDPAAGAEISETVPTGARWRLISLQATLVTDATAANRSPAFRFDDGANAYAHLGAQASQTATQTLRYTLCPGGGGPLNTTNGQLLTAPSNPLLAAGHRITTNTAGIVAGDNWGAPQYSVEEWLEAV